MRSVRLLTTAGVSAVLAVAGLSGQAQAPAPAPNSPLPVRQVTLFTSGVSYTERSGEVDGNAAIPLSFGIGQVNDILKSMILLDERGRVQPATYAAKDPISHSLKSFSVDVSQNVSLPDLLAQLRGAKVAIEVGEKSVSGQIVSVEQRVVAVQNDKPFVSYVLNILTETGLTWVRLDNVNTIRLLDEKLNREFREALGLLATGADDQRRQVVLHFSGAGKRTVRVGYVTEAPLWKMSYRLIMGAAPGQPAAKPYLQGWAHVENTSDEDWQGIRLALVSGRPVSFIQDLYQPLYLPRPVVGPDVIASAFPQTHEGSLLDSEKQQRLADRLAAFPRITGGAFLGTRSDRAMGMGGGRGGAGGPPASPNTGTLLPEGIPNILPNDMDNTIIVRGNMEKLRQSVSAQAQGEKTGESFQYVIKTPVTLPRQQAAMIPVIAGDIDGEKLLLFNIDASGKFPWNAFRIRNNTGMHLKAGPLTLFDDGVYAGDAKMDDIPPGDDRLISYAVDNSVEGERQDPRELILSSTFSLRNGVMTIKRKLRHETTYTLKSRSDRAKNVLVEHPFDAAFKLVEPVKPEERTAGVYRFLVPVAAGKSQTLKIVQERMLQEQIGILGSDSDALAIQIQRKDIPAKLREALEGVQTRRAHISALQVTATAREAEIAAMGTDQDRIRKNMAALDKMSALYKRYVAELDRQETSIQALRLEAAKLRKEASEAERELRAYVEGIVIPE